MDARGTLTESIVGPINVKVALFRDEHILRHKMHGVLLNELSHMIAPKEYTSLEQT